MGALWTLQSMERMTKLDQFMNWLEKRVPTSDSAKPYIKFAMQEYAEIYHDEQKDLMKSVDGSADNFEKDLFKLINDYCKQGLEKKDLVQKMEWATGNCKMS